jgi:hypothetical protein
VVERKVEKRNARDAGLSQFANSFGLLKGWRGENTGPRHAQEREIQREKPEQKQETVPTSGAMSSYAYAKGWGG